MGEGILKLWGIFRFRDIGHLFKGEKIPQKVSCNPDHQAHSVMASASLNLANGPLCEVFETAEVSEISQ